MMICSSPVLIHNDFIHNLLRIMSKETIRMLIKNKYNNFHQTEEHVLDLFNKIKMHFPITIRNCNGKYYPTIFITYVEICYPPCIR